MHSHSSERLIETLRVPKETCSKEAAGASEFASELVVDADVSECALEDAGLPVWEASVEVASVEGASVDEASVEGASVDRASVEGASDAGASVDGGSVDGAPIRGSVSGA